MDLCSVRSELSNTLVNDIPCLIGYELIIWGTGYTATYAQEGIKRFSNSHPWMRIIAYCDSNPKKWNKKFYDKDVLSPTQLEQYYPIEKRETVFILISARSKNAIQEIKDWLTKRHFHFCLLDEMILKQDADKVLNCYDLLDDYASKILYYKIVLAYLAGFPESQDLETEKLTYFAHPALRDRELLSVFIDCGAYIGDTLQAFIDFTGGKFDRYIAFEPDELNYHKLKKRVQYLQRKWLIPETRFQLNGCAVSNKTESLSYMRDISGNGLGTRIIDTTIAKGEIYSAITAIALDEFLKGPYTYLKADIEGFEYRMLCGARKGIRKYRPFIAISIYHNIVDLYSLLLLIHDIEPNYKFSIMHHTKTFDDTVLYCWFEEKKSVK